MKMMFLAVAAAAISVPAFAQEAAPVAPASVAIAEPVADASAAPAQQLLWDKVEIDMPFTRAKELYPDAHVYSGKGLFRPMLSIDEYLIGDCKASVAILIDRKVADPAAKVEGVRLSGEGCDSKMFNALIARYGEPVDVNNDNDDKKKTARWTAEGRSITFRRDGRGWSDSWEINYAPLRDLGL